MFYHCLYPAVALWTRAVAARGTGSDSCAAIPPLREAVNVLTRALPHRACSGACAVPTCAAAMALQTHYRSVIARLMMPLTLVVGQVLALKKLYEAVDYHWAEISESVSHIEALYEDESFPQRDLAAAVASKVRVLVRCRRRLMCRSCVGTCCADYFFFLKTSVGSARLLPLCCSASTTWRCTKTRCGLL